MQEIAMQIRCVRCGLEQYAPAVWSISHGKHPCCWCGGMSEQMTHEEYRQKISELKKLKESAHA